MDPHDDLPDVSIPSARPTDGCAWCLGYFDGYQAGENGIDLEGNPYAYDPVLLGDPNYRDGTSTGRADRIAATTNR